jgi:hypothetical protein
VAKVVAENLEIKKPGWPYSQSIRKPPAHATATPLKMMPVLIAERLSRYSSMKIAPRQIGNMKSRVRLNSKAAS